MANNRGERGLARFVNALGVALMVLGVLFVVGQAINTYVERLGWPILFVMLPGISLFVFALVMGGRTGERWALVGGSTTVAGAILLYQSAADHFQSWAYAWTLVLPTSVGLGRLVYGRLKGQGSMVEAGRRLVVVGIVLFLVGAVFFELVINVSGFGIGLGRFGVPVSLIGLGLLLLLGKLLYDRQRR